LITAPVTIIIQHQLDAAFFFLALSVNICSLLTFGLIFVSKVALIFQLVTSAKSLLFNNITIYFKVKHVIRHSAEQDLYDQTHDENQVRLKKEKYFNLVKSNEELKELVSKVTFF
jgi:hypothetical protein